MLINFARKFTLLTMLGLALFIFTQDRTETTSTVEINEQVGSLINTCLSETCLETCLNTKSLDNINVDYLQRLSEEEVTNE